MTTFLGWELLTPSSAMKIARQQAKTKQSLKTTKPDNLQSFKSGNYIWYNIYFPEYLPEVKADCQKFLSISDLTDPLLGLFDERLSDEQGKGKLLKSISYRYQESKPTTLSQIRRRFSEVFSGKRLRAYSWCIKFVSLAQDSNLEQDPKPPLK